jgi:hypothetical protein
METNRQAKAANSSAPVQLVGREAGTEMTDGQTFPVTSKSTGGVREVRVHTAKSGPHAGEQYLTCNCPAGRFAWSPAGFRPCKHMREVIEKLDIQMVAGHVQQQ